MSLLGKKLNEISPEDLELIKEAAGALARYGEKLEKALAHLRAAEEMMDKIFSSPLHQEGAMIQNGTLLEETPGRTPLSCLTEVIEQYQEARQQAEQARYINILYSGKQLALEITNSQTRSSLYRENEEFLKNANLLV